MVRNVEYSYLCEVFPNYYSDIQMTIVENPPEYVDNIVLLDNKKLRIINGNLELDNRKFQFFWRSFSGDNRWIILEKLKSLNRYDLIIRLSLTTYANDKKWVYEANKWITNVKKTNLLKPST